MHTVALACLLALAAPAGEPDGLSLEEAIRLALQDNPLLEAARGGLEEFEARYRQASLAFVPQAKLDFSATMLPRITGNAVEHETDNSVWGPYLRTQFTLVQPIWSFGKLTHLKEMAEAGIDIGKAQVRMAEGEIRYQTARAWYTLVFTSQVEEIITEGEEYLEKARKRLEDLEEEDADDFDQVDKLRLRVYEAEIASMRMEAARAARLARYSLHLLTGLPEDEIQPSEKRLKPVPFSTWTLPDLERLARQSRPDLAALEASVRALRVKVTVEERKWAPDLFAAGNVTVNWAPYVENQRSPFADDPYNTYLGTGFALGFQWKLDIGARIAGTDEARAGVRKMRSNLDALLLKARLDLMDKFTAAADAETLISIYRSAYKAGRGWAMAKTDLYENGLEELKHVIEGITKLYSTKLAHMNAVLQFNLAVAALARACGVPTEEMAPDAGE
ncbi:MAG: TolC family protein [Pseudomonadota bacterium]